MTTEVIREVREAEAKVLEGYTMMAVGISILASLNRQMAMDADAASNAIVKTLGDIHQVLSDLGFPRDESIPDLKLIERIHQLAAHSKPEAAIQTLQETLGFLNYAVTGNEPIERLASLVSEHIRTKLERARREASSRLDIINRCHQMLTEAGVPEGGTCTLLSERIQKLIDGNIRLQEVIDELQHGKPDPEV